MYKTKLCLGIMGSLGIPAVEQIKMFKEAGFEAFFYEWTPGCNLDEIVKAAEENGMEFHNVHAPFSGPGNVSALWEQNERTETSFGTLMECIRDCAEHGIKLIILHTFIGFDKHEPTEVGVRMYGRLIEYAEKLGVNIALENTEGEEYLAAIMERFWNEESVGFCLDTGHEMCYNRHKDMLALYGEKLCHTHFNDNLGVRGEEITFHDDLHLMPTDGIADWHGIMERIRKTGYDGILMSELSYADTPGKNGIIHKYTELSMEEFMREAYEKIKTAISM